MLKLRTLLLALSCFLLASVSAQSEEITINVDGNYPPFMYDDNGVAKGLYTRLIKKVFAEMGRKVKVQAIPWKRLVKEIDEAKAGAGGIYRTEPRLKKYDYSVAISANRLAVFVRKGSGLKIKTIADLKDLKVGMVHGWSYPKKLTQALENKLFQDVRARTEKINIKWLADGRLDAAIAVFESIQLSGDEWEVSGLIEPAAILRVTKSYIAFNKKAGKKELLKQFDKTFLKLKKAGAFEKASK